MLSRKRRRNEPPITHPRNKYSDKPPDFRLLASLYPSFHPFVSSSRQPTIDWTDFNATRELTRVLLLHDHGVNWWIPDGQLCPTVPNRSNYIYWIGDLLSSEIIPKKVGCEGGRVRGFDIGTGANCIYPLLGASLFGWSFVGSDVTEVGLEWARKNVESNPHLSDLIEIRNAAENVQYAEMVLSSEGNTHCEAAEQDSVGQSPYHGSQILVGVIRDDEEFDFCMCNPPFFERMEEAGLNPKTACGGTYEEMVCPGGEQAFISRIIEDSVRLKHSFRWFTSMVGRKNNLKILVSRLHDVGVLIVKTTEFVQGQTARWGLAWSFTPPNTKSVVLQAPAKSHHSFMIEGFQRQFGAIHILKATESFFLASGALCKSDLTTFFMNVTLPSDQISVILEGGDMSHAHDRSDSLQLPSDGLSFRVSVFEQIPGTILVKGSVLHKETPFSGIFSSLLHNLEDSLKRQFLKKLDGRCGT